MKRNAGDLIAALILVALVYVLVRPRSDGPALVATVTSAFVAVVRNAADLAAPSN